MKTRALAMTMAVACVASLAPARAAFPADVAALMDTRADPCEDFYQYTCGGWMQNQNHTVSADHDAYAYSFNGVGERNKRIVHEIMREDWPLIGELYDSCMAVETLSAMGNVPLQKDLVRIYRATTKSALANITGQLGTIGPSLFTSLNVAQHVNDTSLNVLYIRTAEPVLPDLRVYVDDAAFSQIEPAFRKYISTIAVLAGIRTTPEDAVVATVSTKHIEDVVIAIEKAYVGILPTEPSVYTSLPYHEAATRFPLTVQAKIQGTQLLDTSPLTVDSNILFGSLTFMDRAEKLFDALTLHDLKLYFSFLYVNAYAVYLGDAFVQASFDFFGRTFVGLRTRSPRAQICAAAQLTLFPELIGRYYFLKTFDVEREQNVQLLVQAVEKAMGDHIAALTWLDEATRREAAAKLAKITNLIGRSTESITYPFVLTRDNYFANVQTIRTQAWHQDRAQIGKSVDRSKWVISAASVNAYYSPWENKIVLPAGILQPPFFKSIGAHPVQNFGAIGAVIGHELTHGFDPSGRHYDGDGNLREWWTENTATEFEARATCMQNQYSQMLAYGDSGAAVGWVNGNLTVAENIADNGGASLAFDAYHSWVQSGGKVDAIHGVDDDEVDRLFFVSFAQIWCGKISDRAQQKLLAADIHAPKPTRVNGVAMNSQQFATTFQCKVGSAMNPKTKCTLW